MAAQRRPHRFRGTSTEVERAARDLRRRMTPAEALLWSALRRHQLDGMQFRRQHPVGRFVLDFYCPAAKLAIELDGEVHGEQAERDAERTAVLSAAGYRVMRFRNQEVLDHLDSVLERIRAAIRREPGSPPPNSGEGLGEGATPPAMR
ncbi:MAG: endonuclease domain-containing protein [Gemmatimonadetes bacterium]|nr:endonuclease domain-containing protein [Gemmatimonadota bacterium]